MVSDKLNGWVDPDSLNKAVDLLFGLALGTNDNPTMVSSIWRLFRGFTCCGLTLIVKWCLESTNTLYMVEENGSKTASWLPKTASEPFWEPWALGAAKGSKQALKTSSKKAASSRDSESLFSGLLEPLWVLRQQMCSLRLLQNECIVFVPPGASRVGSLVWGGCFGLVFKKRLSGSLKRHDKG